MSYRDCSNYTLRRDGVAVIENIVSEEEVEDLRETMWEWLHHKTRHTSSPVEREDPSTYASLFELFPKHGMLFQHWDFGHNPMSWRLRQHDKIIKVFADIHKTEELLTSFDGISVSLPTHRGFYQGREWFHSDQCFLRNGFECVQGFVNLYDVNDGDATLRVLRGSHLLHGKFQERFRVESTSDWFVLGKGQKDFYTDALGEECDVCVKAGAGSIVLWDSRTIHQGIERARGTSNIRCVPYVCMTPASLANSATLKKRIRYFEERRTCNHWPHKIKVFPKFPRTYGAKVPRVDQDEDLQVTPLMRKLVGYDYL